VGSQSDDEIKKTYINSTKRQRAYWTSLMLDEKRRTGDASLNLSEWIIRQLPNPDSDEGEGEGEGGPPSHL